MPMYLAQPFTTFSGEAPIKCKTIITKLFLKVLSHSRQFHEDMLKGFVLFVSALGITKGNRKSRKGYVNCRLLWCILSVSRVFCFIRLRIQSYIQTLSDGPCHHNNIRFSCLKSKKTLNYFWMISYPRSVHTALSCDNFDFKIGTDCRTFARQ